MRNDFDSNYLAHWGIKKGGKKENHKYYERVEKNGKYLYFYTQAEYEAWLHKGNKALDSVGKKAKNALSDLKNKLGKKDTKTKLSNTKSSLLNAIGRGREAAYQLANRSSLTLTKQNASKVIDRGTKKINSILNQTSNKATTAVNSLQKSSKAAVNSLQKSSKAASANISSKAKSIADRVSKTLQKAGKDTQRAVKQYIDKGEKTIKQTLAKSGNVKLGPTTAKQEKAGMSIVTSILASVAAAVVIAAAKVVIPKVAKKVKEVIDKVFNPEVTVTITTETTPKEAPKEKPPKDFASDAADSYKEDRAVHSDIPQKKEPTNRDDDMAAVNPNYTMSDEDRKRQEQLIEDYYQALYRGDEEELEKILKEYREIEDKYIGFMNNCVNCTLTYDLRRRGYDVDAPWNPNGTYTDSLFEWYEVTEEDFVGYDTGSDRAISKKEARQIKEALEDMYPEGSYGHCNLRWADGGGHDCVWSIENGEVVIRDCQTNQLVPFEEYATMSKNMNFVRTDDKKLKDQAYEVAVADKTNAWGETDRDDYEDDEYDTRDYDAYVEDNQVKVKNEDDLNYDKYWRKAAGKKRK